MTASAHKHDLAFTSPITEIRDSKDLSIVFLPDDPITIMVKSPDAIQDIAFLDRDE
jgi:hypothetical protein